MFAHRKLKVYQLSVSYLTSAKVIIKSLPPGNADLANELRRASFSIALNIAEGAGKTGKDDKRRYYSIARGSALECAAIIDVITAFELGNGDVLTDALGHLEQIAAMLSALVIRKD